MFAFSRVQIGIAIAHCDAVAAYLLLRGLDASRVRSPLTARQVAQDSRRQEVTEGRVGRIGQIRPSDGA
jgi:hypothetical protein